MTTKPKKNGRQNYDWEAIKIDYVTNQDLSLKKIADKYGISDITVAKKSKADNWFATKQKYQRDTTMKAIEKVSTKKANSMAKLIETSDKMLQHINKAVADMEQFNKWIVTENAPAPEGIGTVSVTYEKVFDKVDARAMKDIASSMKTIAELMGYQTPAQIEKQKLDRERFEWEKQQAAEKSGQSGDGVQTGVVLMPPILEVKE